MKKHGPQAQELVNPNLIPMIDIMFLLLLFFMLGADMGRRDVEILRLPKASQAKEEPPTETRDKRLTFNAHHREKAPCADYADSRICRNNTHWEIAFRGKDCSDPELLAAALSEDTGTKEAVTEKRVMIRADAGAPFGLAQRVMLACAQKGIYKVEVGASIPKKDR
jgi:biopolymer transport protein ExbD